MGFTFGPGGGVNSLPVPYQIVFDGGITEAYPETGPTATVIFQCTWDNHYQLVQGLLGLWTGTPPSTIVYIGPFQYPFSTNLICTSISAIEPYDKSHIPGGFAVPWLTRKMTRITAQFTRPPWQPLASGGYFSLSFNGSGEFFTLPETTYRFPDGTPTNTPIGIVLPQAEITVTRYRMPYIPDQAMIPLVGQLNNAPFQIGYNTYASGNLLFSIGNTKTEADVLGNITYTVEYKFMYRPVDWNWYYHPDRTTGWALVTNGNGDPPYGYSDFSQLP